jgi:cytoskeletal protein RodZ
MEAHEQVPARPRRGVTPERVVALLGVVGLLAVAVVIASMVMDAARGEDEEQPAATPAERRTDNKSAAREERKPKKKPRPKLTAAQREQRTAAATQVRNQGFEPMKLSTWRPEHTLRVLVGTPKDQPSGGQRAFFFVGDAYIGTDATTPSAGIRVSKQSERRITLVYNLVEGTKRVRFRWNGSQLEPIDPIPSAAARAPTG